MTGCDTHGKRAGLSGTQVRERTDIGESSLSELENGKRRAKPKPIAETGGLVPSFHLVLFCRRPDCGRTGGPLADEPGKRMPRRSRSRFLRLCEQYHNLEVWCDERASRVCCLKQMAILPVSVTAMPRNSPNKFDAIYSLAIGPDSAF